MQPQIPRTSPGTPRLEDRSGGKYIPVQEATDAQRVEMVKDIFSTVTARYDFLNHFLSLRRDIAWRRSAVRKMSFGRTNRFLDVATGTADLAIGAALRHPRITVAGVDFSPEMLAAGRLKVEKKGLSDRVCLMRADALALPFADGAFDVAGIAFGIRNIPDKARALQEMARVVVPGGQVMVLEMAFTRNWFSQALYCSYLNRLLPRIASRFSINPGAYYYLADSIMSFPSPDRFSDMMREAGMAAVERYKLTFGATYLYVGTSTA
jgi:demethylmenaquinone methyltransferase/2-methoxy-6-polyprenyl-1,4-benzoquinol methylase